MGHLFVAFMCHPVVMGVWHMFSAWAEYQHTRIELHLLINLEKTVCDDQSYQISVWFRNFIMLTSCEPSSSTGVPSTKKTWTC